MMFIHKIKQHSSCSLLNFNSFPTNLARITKSNAARRERGGERVPPNNVCALCYYTRGYNVAIFIVTACNLIMRLLNSAAREAIKMSAEDDIARA
jgi:hypothetical protein